jgi:ribosomal protein L19
MNEEFKRYLEKFDDETRKRFTMLYELVHESTTQTIQEKLWAKLPSFYVGDHFIRIIPFNDHINIEAKAILSHKESLNEFQMTPKGMLQIKHKQIVPKEVLKKIIQESFE